MILKYPQALRVVWLPILTTLPKSELPGLGSPPSNDLSADLSTGILGGASLAKLMADSRGRQSRLDDLGGLGAQSRALCSGCRYNLISRITEGKRKHSSVVKRTMGACTTVTSAGPSASPVTAAHLRPANTIATNVKR